MKTIFKTFEYLFKVVSSDSYAHNKLETYVHMQTKKYFMFSCCNHALRVFKTFSIKLMAYVMQQHLLLATFYYSMLTILFWSGHNDITDEHFDEHYFWYVSEDSKKTKKKIAMVIPKYLFFLGFCMSYSICLISTKDINQRYRSTKDINLN